MIVFLKVLSGRNEVYVKVENINCGQGKMQQACFFISFTQGDLRHVSISIGMAARLQPFVELGVMHQQSLCHVLRHNECRGGNVTG